MGGSNMVKIGSPIAVILRGALGGALGGFVLLLVLAIWYIVTLGGIPYAHLFIIPGLPLMLAIGVLAGVLVGGAILLARMVAGREFGPISRAVIGFVIIIIALLV